MSYLTAVWEIFRFIKRYRERAEQRLALEAQERADERQHQREMLTIIFGKMAERDTAQFSALTAIAEASAKQANVMQTWIDGFRNPDPTPTPPISMNDAEEWVREQIQERGLENTDLAMLPQEFRLAYLQQLQDSESDDSEG